MYDPLPVPSTKGPAAHCMHGRVVRASGSKQAASKNERQQWGACLFLESIPMLLAGGQNIGYHRRWPCLLHPNHCICASGMHLSSSGMQPPELSRPEHGLPARLMRGSVCGEVSPYAPNQAFASVICRSKCMVIVI